MLALNGLTATQREIAVVLKDGAYIYRSDKKSPRALFYKGKSRAIPNPTFNALKRVKVIELREVKAPSGQRLRAWAWAGDK